MRLATVACRTRPKGYDEDGEHLEPLHIVVLTYGRSTKRAPERTARGETMDTQQLKQLAVRVRAFLAKVAIEIGHGQALDLSASLVGLR